MFCDCFDKVSWKMTMFFMSLCFLLLITSRVGAAEDSVLSAGEKAPQFSLIDTNNISWISKNFFNNDRLVIFYFFDIESEACRQELKFLSSINKDNADDVDILAITSNASEQLASFIREEKLNLTILIDKDRQVSNLYHAMSVFPTTFFINEKGDIIEVVVGSPGDTEAILSLLLNADKKQVKKKKVVQSSVAVAPVSPPPSSKEVEKVVPAKKAKPKPTEVALAKVQEKKYTTYTNGKSKKKPKKVKIPREIAGYISDLESGDFSTMRNAAKRIYRGRVSHVKLYKTLSVEVEKGYMIGDDDRLQADTIAWLCKALSVSGFPEAKGILNEVISGTPSKKIKKHAVKSLKVLEKMR